MVSFLEGFKYFAVVLVALSAPAFGWLAFMPLLFCDSGPVSGCLKMAVFIWGIPVVQIVSLIMAWRFLKKRHYIPLSAGLMIVSVAPMLAGMTWLALSRMHR